MNIIRTSRQAAHRDIWIYPGKIYCQIKIKRSWILDKADTNIKRVSAVCDGADTDRLRLGKIDRLLAVLCGDIPDLPRNHI
jgi:hypothetical protein